MTKQKTTQKNQQGRKGHAGSAHPHQKYFDLYKEFNSKCQKGTKAEYKKVFALMPLVRILQL